MKTVVQNIANEIEYLSALARMIECGSQAHAATLESVNALRRLLQVIDDSPKGTSESVLRAA
jgi:hypothetical protein